MKLSFVQQICSAYSDGLAAGLRDDRTRPVRVNHEIEELARAYEIGCRDGAMMRERKMRLDSGAGVYQ